MTTTEKIERLKQNIRRAEAAAMRAVEEGNDFSQRMNLDFAEECRTELRIILAA